MGNDTAVVKLSSLVRVKGGKRLPKGTNLQVQKNAHPYIRVRDMGEMFIPTENLEYVPDEVFPAIKNYIVNKDDILISIVGTIGLISIVDDNHHLSSQTENCAKLHGLNGLDVYYLYYYLTSNYGQEEIKRGTVGAVQAKLPLYAIENIDVIWPEKERRRSIALLLKSIDDKIHINRQINQTLEQMAQALFKSWFVDFDPVVDNALDAGFFEQDLAFPDELLRRAEARKAVRDSTASLEKSKPLPDAIRQLFPAAFEECAEPSLGLGGWVPQGWKPSNVGAEFDVTMGQSPPGSTYNEIGDGMPFFQGKTDFGFRFPSNRVYCTEPKRLARKHDTLISVRAPVGDINLAAEDCAIGRGLAAARHKSGSISFSYYSMNSLSKYFEVFEGEGTVFGSINQKDFNALPLIQYPSELITKFGEHCERWDQRIENITVEVLALTSLRDTLLPKLISGELRLDEIEVDIAEQGVA